MDRWTFAAPAWCRTAAAESGRKRAAAAKAAAADSDDEGGGGGYTAADLAGLKVGSVGHRDVLH